MGKRSLVAYSSSKARQAADGARTQERLAQDALTALRDAHAERRRIKARHAKEMAMANAAVHARTAACLEVGWSLRQIASRLGYATHSVVARDAGYVEPRLRS